MFYFVNSRNKHYFKSAALEPFLITKVHLVGSIHPKKIVRPCSSRTKRKNNVSAQFSCNHVLLRNNSSFPCVSNPNQALFKRTPTPQSSCGTQGPPWRLSIYGLISRRHCSAARYLTPLNGFREQNAPCAINIIITVSPASRL